MNEKPRLLPLRTNEIERADMLRIYRLLVAFCLDEMPASVDEDLPIDSAISGVCAVALYLVAGAFSCIQNDLLDGMWIHLPQIGDD